MELTILTKKNTLVSIYGPNEDKPNFYKNLKQKIQHFENENVTICGDWNLVLNPDVDTENYLHINNPRARMELLKFIEEDNFIDVYRNLHDAKGFTWRKLNPVKKQARLDFFLVSEESLNLSMTIVWYQATEQIIQEPYFVLNLIIMNAEKVTGSSIIHFWKTIIQIV